MVFEILAPHLDLRQSELVLDDGAKEIHEHGGQDDIVAPVPPDRSPVFVTAKGNTGVSVKFPFVTCLQYIS